MSLSVFSTSIASFLISQHHDVAALNTSLESSSNMLSSLAAPPPPPGQWNVWLGAAIYQYEDEKKGGRYPVFPFIWIDSSQPFRAEVVADSDGRRSPRIMRLPKEFHGIHPVDTEYRDIAGEVIQKIWFIGTTHISDTQQMIEVFAEIWEESPFYRAGRPRGYKGQWNSHIEFNVMDKLYQRILVHPWLPVTPEWQMWRHLMDYATRYFSHVISVWLHRIDRLEVETLPSGSKDAFFMGYIIERGGSPRPLRQSSEESYNRDHFLALSGFTQRDHLPNGLGFMSEDFILHRRKVNQTFHGRSSAQRPTP